MAIIRVNEPFAALPKVPTPHRCAAPDAEDLEVDRGLLELSGVDLQSGSVDFDEITEAEDMLIEDSIVHGVDLTPMGGSTLDIVRSSLDQCDLSRLTVRSIRASHVVGAKLVGTELSGSLLTDVVFEHCTFRYANLRMATLRRVCFAECQFVDVDAFEATMEDVDFEGSTIAELNVDRLSAARVDLRRASTIDLTGVGNLRGLLVAEEQLPALAYQLAAAAGLDIEASAEQEAL
ncbi:MAG: pentapeptide repeat-containing protein [Acidimicrobiales bacterium]